MKRNGAPFLRNGCAVLAEYANDVFDIAFDVSAFTNYNTGDIRYSKGGINVERNDISESDYEAYINELKPIEWKKLP